MWMISQGIGLHGLVGNLVTVPTCGYQHLFLWGSGKSEWREGMSKRNLGLTRADHCFRPVAEP